MDSDRWYRYMDRANCLLAAIVIVLIGCGVLR